MRIKPLLWAAALATLAVSAQAAQTNAASPAAADPNKPFLIVNGITIPASHAEVVRRDRAGRGADAENVSDEAIRDALTTLEVLAQTAERKGLDKRPDVKAVLELQRKELLVKLLQDDFVKSQTIADERIKAEYDKAKGKAGETEYLARHILVPDEKLAKDLIAQLKKDKKLKFEDLAKKHSKDSSAKDGGTLGWMVPGNLVPEFAQAMVALKKGDYTAAPVKTRFGWHIVKLEDVRKLDFPAYDKVKANIAKQLLQIDFRKHVDDLRSAAKVEAPKP
jgi:peptidyl-prolyl cis-trans isomerase C